MASRNMVCLNGEWRDGTGQPVPLHRCQLENHYCGKPPFVIPRVWAERAYKEYALQYGTSQTLERLEERGGFGVAEIIGLLIDALERSRGEQ